MYGEWECNKVYIEVVYEFVILKCIDKNVLQFVLETAHQ